MLMLGCVRPRVQHARMCSEAQDEMGASLTLASPAPPPLTPIPPHLHPLSSPHLTSPAPSHLPPLMITCPPSCACSGTGPTIGRAVILNACQLGCYSEAGSPATQCPAMPCNALTTPSQCPHNSLSPVNALLFAAFGGCPCCVCSRERAYEALIRPPSPPRGRQELVETLGGRQELVETLGGCPACCPECWRGAV